MLNINSVHAILEVGPIIIPILQRIRMRSHTLV